jgi:hypothetical protein
MLTFSFFRCELPCQCLSGPAIFSHMASARITASRHCHTRNSGLSAGHTLSCGSVPKSKAVLPFLRAAAGAILRGGGDFFASGSFGMKRIGTALSS